LNQKGQSFVEAFVRRNDRSLSGVEVWRFYNGMFELYFERPDPADADTVEQATRLLGDLSHRETTGRIVSFHEISERLGADIERLGQLAGVIETSLKAQGIRVERMRDSFRLPLPI
jgi:hypothetical protein